MVRQVSGSPPSPGQGSTPLPRGGHCVSVVTDTCTAPPGGRRELGLQTPLGAPTGHTGLSRVAGTSDSTLVTRRRPPAAPAASCSRAPATPASGPVSLATSDVVPLVLASVQPRARLDRAVFRPWRCCPPRRDPWAGGRGALPSAGASTPSGAPLAHTDVDPSRGLTRPPFRLLPAPRFHDQESLPRPAPRGLRCFLPRLSPLRRHLQVLDRARANSRVRRCAGVQPRSSARGRQPPAPRARVAPGPVRLSVLPR